MVVLLSECGTDTAKGLTACHSEAVFELSDFAKPNRSKITDITQMAVNRLW